MRRAFCFGLCLGVGAFATAWNNNAQAGDGGGWPTVDSGSDAGTAGSGGSDGGGWPTVDAGKDAGWPSVDSGTGGSDAGADGGPSPGAILAYYCGDVEMQCATAPIEFEKKIDLWNLKWDTGWIPDNSGLQVRFALIIPAETYVKINGDFEATWPQAITLATPGSRYTGLLKFDYGLEVIARGKIDVSIAGVPVQWEGDLPYLPNYDFHLLGAAAFDNWMFKPKKVEAQAFTESATLFKLNILGLMNIPSQIAEGGVALNIKGELKAGFTTNKMDITPSKGPITFENGTTTSDFKGGGFAEYKVHPEGVVVFDGYIHLIPTFYVQGPMNVPHFEIPVYDYPVHIPIGQQEFVFPSSTIHVPFPDVVPLKDTTIDYGKVAVGSGSIIKIPIANIGEGKARASIKIEDTTQAKTFKVLSPTIKIDPGKSDDSEIRFVPKKLGTYEAKLTIATNDPDLPLQTVTLKGEAVPDDEVPEDSGSTQKDSGQADVIGSSFDGSGDSGGCGCRFVDSSSSSSPTWLLISALSLLSLRRRRRPSAA